MHSALCRLRNAADCKTVGHDHRLEAFPLPVSSQSISPLIRWAGSKRASITSIAAFYPGNQYRYVEPFCGSAALFTAVNPEFSILSDANPKLINFYEQVKENPVELHNRYSKIQFSKENYYKVRSLYNKCSEKIDQGAYFLFLNQYCFNGLYRTNLKGEFNVPFSGVRNAKHINKDRILQHSLKLQGATLRTGDFEAVIDDYISEKTFLFVDPPYANRDGTIFTEYGSTLFGLEDLERLMTQLRKLDRRGGKFVLTYDSSLPALVHLESSWRRQVLTVRRNVSGFASARKTVDEILVSNT